MGKDESEAYRAYNESMKRMKIGSGWALFYKIKEKYNVHSVENKNNVLHFNIDDEKYLFGLPSRKLKLQGETKWTGKVLTTIKKRHEEKPKEKKEKLNVFTFGKYKDKSIDYVRENDEQYLEWCIENVKYFKKNYNY